MSELKNPKDRESTADALDREDRENRDASLEMVHSALATAAQARTMSRPLKGPPRLHQMVTIEHQIDRLLRSAAFCKKENHSDLLKQVKIALREAAERLEELLLYPDHMRSALINSVNAVRHHKMLAYVIAAKFDLDPWSRHSLLVYEEKPASKLSAPVIPSAPPGGETYDKRQDRKERAPDFIQRVYGPWLDGSLTRADLRKLDPKAEIALSNWERKNGRGDLNLPTKKEQHDRLFAEGALNADDLAHSARLLAALSYRSKKT